MANWTKLNKEFYDRLNNMTDTEWDKWYNNLKIKRSMETQEQCRMTKDVVKTVYIPHTHDKLGINIHIPENATIEINKAGAKKEYLIDSVEIIFGIGKDFVGYITMDAESYKALKNGEPITILPFTEE